MFRVSHKAMCDIKKRNPKIAKMFFVGTGAKGILFTALPLQLIEKAPTEYGCMEYKGLP
jgi:hypothetical protein